MIVCDCVIFVLTDAFFHTIRLATVRAHAVCFLRRWRSESIRSSTSLPTALTLPTSAIRGCARLTDFRRSLAFGWSYAK